MLEGEAGVGKSALLGWAISKADDFRVVRAFGTPSDAHLPFAGLSDLTLPLLEFAGSLPPAQADALRSALALTGPSTPFDRFAIAAALLRLLSSAAEESPLLVAVDDLQWLDRESCDALMFAARRVDGGSLAMLFAARSEEIDRALIARLPVLTVESPREPEPPALLHLTGQEARIALLIAAGRTNRQIADELYLSIKTIEGHTHAIYRKLGVRSRVELTVKLLTQPTDEAEAS